MRKGTTKESKPKEPIIRFNANLTITHYNRLHDLAFEMGISMAELTEKLIDNFYKFREYDSQK